MKLKNESIAFAIHNTQFKYYQGRAENPIPFCDGIKKRIENIFTDHTISTAMFLNLFHKKPEPTKWMVCRRPKALKDKPKKAKPNFVLKYKMINEIREDFE